MNLSRRGSRLLWVAVFAVPAVAAYQVERQGFNLLDDGLWALGTRVLADGGLLYRDIFTVYGPASYYALLPFFLVLGESVRSLVVFKALASGCAALLGFRIARRCGAGGLAWLVPIGVLALGSVAARYVCATAFAALHGEGLRNTRRPTLNGLISGFAWGILSLFGLDMFICGAVIVLGGRLITRQVISGDGSAGDPRLSWLLVGLTGVLVLAFTFAVATGTLGPALWDTLICPLTYSPHHMQQNAAAGFVRARDLATPFSQVFTGEHLGPAWPGHMAIRTAAIRSIAAISVGVPLLALLMRRHLSDPRFGHLVALVLSNWVIVIWRSDVAHILAVFHGTLIVAACFLGAIRESHRPAARLGTALLVAVMIPIGAERIWLAANAGRPSLVQWDRATAGILMARDRLDTIERVLEALDVNSGAPTIAWPAQPGLVFLSGRPLATRQVTLLAGSVHDESAVIAELRSSDHERLVLGRVAGLAPGASSLAELVPGIWTHLRANYRIETQLADGAEGFQVIGKAGAGSVEGDVVPLERRLPGTSQLVKNSQTPPMGAGVVVSQGFRAGGLDLRGIALLVAMTGPLPTEVDVEVEIKEALSGGRTQSRGLYRSRMPLDQRVQLRTLAFPVLGGTAGKLIVLDVCIVPDAQHEVRLLWHDQRQDSDGQIDYYRDGQASVNGMPVDADLFFVSY